MKKKFAILLASLIFSSCSNGHQSKRANSSHHFDVFKDANSTIHYFSKEYIKTVDQIKELNVIYVDSLDSSNSYNESHGRKSEVKSNKASKYVKEAREKLASSVYKHVPLALNNAGVPSKGIMIDKSQLPINLSKINKLFPNRLPKQPILIVKLYRVNTVCTSGCNVAFSMNTVLINTVANKKAWSSSCRLPVRKAYKNNYESLGKEMGKEVVRSLREALLIS